MSKAEVIWTVQVQGPVQIEPTIFLSIYALFNWKKTSWVQNPDNGSQLPNL